MKEKLLYVAGFIVFVGAVMYPYFASADLYAKHSLERLDLCLKHSTERNESPTLCGEIGTSADAAYRAARRESGGLNTVVILMFGGFSVLAYKVRLLSRELDEVKSRTDV